ncbi:MAG: hypothetical protein ACKV2Q_03335 [Planctomycetaceae bacterium]
MKNIPVRQVVVCMVSLVAWVLLYAAGLLLESIEQRVVLAPHAMEKQLGKAGEKVFTKAMANHDVLPDAWSFFRALICYSPTNMALLTLISAFLGGCVSNAVVSSMEESEVKRMPARRVAFLSENPLAATMRGFVAYLCLIAGLYVAMDDPFKDGTPGQYARLAGSLSLVAFVVGYDPTRIEGWLRMAASPQGFGGRPVHEVSKSEVPAKETSAAPARVPVEPSAPPRS